MCVCAEMVSGTIDHVEWVEESLLLITCGEDLVVNNLNIHMCVISTEPTATGEIVEIRDRHSSSRGE